MTREEIEKATLTWTLKGRDWRAEMVDFALDVVRRHNEECAVIATGEGGWLCEAIAKTIREAKP